MRNRYVSVTIECKNLRSGSALLVHCAPLDRTEAYHCLLSTEKMALSVVTEKVESPFLRDDPVGKSVDQAVTAKDGSIQLKGDGEIYARYSQAISSSRYTDKKHKRPIGSIARARRPVKVSQDGAGQSESSRRGWGLRVIGR